MPEAPKQHVPASQFGQYPPPRHVVAHFSDPHLLADGKRQFGVVDPEPNLILALDRVRNLEHPPQALVFTGDLADKSEPDAYARLRELVEPVAADLGAVVVWTMGNHDERSDYSLALFGSSSDEPQDRVYDVDGLRIVALDTSVPGFHHGDLDTSQLAWLTDVLAEPAEHGTILAMHHPPIPLPLLRPAELIELVDQHLLAEVIAGSDVRGILAGHLHISTYSTFAGVPVSVASASCYTSDTAPRDRFISGVDGHQALTMVHAYADRLVHTVVPLAEAPELQGYPPDVAAQIEALSADERRAIFSDKASPFNRGEQA